MEKDNCLAVCTLIEWRTSRLNLTNIPKYRGVLDKLSTPLCFIKTGRKGVMPMGEHK